MHQRNHRKLLNAFKTTEGKFVPSVVFMERYFLSTRHLQRLCRPHSCQKEKNLRINSSGRCTKRNLAAYFILKEGGYSFWHAAAAIMSE